MIKWLDVSNLKIINESRITTDNLAKLQYYLERFPENIYVKNDSNELIGIMTIGDVKKSIEFGTIRVNKDFSKFTQFECNQERINLFFSKHRSIRCLPVVNDTGRLIGEYRNIYANIDITEINPKIFRNEVIEYLGYEAIGKVYISASDNGGALREFVLQQGFKLTDIDDADICILADNDFRDILWKNVSTGKEMKQNVTLFKEFMLKCAVRYCFRKFSEHNVDTIVVCPPAPDQIETLTEDEKKWIGESRRPEELIDNDGVLKTVYGENESISYLKSGEYKTSFIKRGNHCALEDASGRYMNVLDGKRATMHIPEKYTRKVYFFGSCIARGAYVSDKYTIESLLQERLNESYPDTFCCVNCGVAGAVGNEYNDFLYMLDTKFSEGDIVIIAAEYSKEIMEIIMECNVRVLETSPLFEHPHDYGRWFLDLPIHMNHIANKVIADRIFREIPEIWEKSMDMKGQSSFAMMELDNVEIPQELQEYLQDVLQKMRGVLQEDNLVGAVVMNCNPFTNGHRYLIEEAAKQVDCLLVFVVQEDESEFSFEDRIDLVRKGTTDLENVFVFASGKYMISSQTFPGYFNKKELQDVVVDSSEDVYTFGRFIAPALHIRKRFVGEEPFDKVTDSYNKQMKITLPEYGVELVEIKRKQCGENAISASRVRELLKNRRFEEIEKLVPETTLRYLMKQVG